MRKRFYFDTSIWLDFLEDRNESNMPKSDWAKELVKKINSKGDDILFSDNNMIELVQLGYSEFEIDELFKRLENNVIHVEATERQIGIAKDLVGIHMKKHVGRPVKLGK